MGCIIDLIHKPCINLVLGTLPVKVYASIPQPLCRIHNTHINSTEILVTYCNDLAMWLKFECCFTSCNVYEWGNMGRLWIQNFM